MSQREHLKLQITWYGYLCELHLRRGHQGRAERYAQRAFEVAKRLEIER